jgi:phytoene/squalene synthetase
MINLYDNVCLKTSKITTLAYSTSFSIGIKLLNRKFHDPIYAIYGFVRFADEIVDTFHDYNKVILLANFRKETYEAIENRISTNPILHSFQWVVNQYNIDLDLIETFLESMRMDLGRIDYNKEKFDQYILGSAEVVGLMCLKVFCEGNQKEYEKLKTYAMRLGAAFQKINFLRDLNADYSQLGRSYFPNVDLSKFDDDVKAEIEADIEEDFKEGLKGITQLPMGARLGVYVAYVYFFKLFQKIKKVRANRVMNERIRIPNQEKLSLLLKSYVKFRLNLL